MFTYNVYLNEKDKVDNAVKILSITLYFSLWILKNLYIPNIPRDTIPAWKKLDVCKCTYFRIFF